MAGVNGRRASVEELWRRALSEYREEQLSERLSTAWPGDGNVAERITCEYPPTFQPGYVGPRYFAQRHRIVMVGQNPGEGSDPVSRGRDSEYRAKLEAYLQEQTDFEDLNTLIASHMLRWDVFVGKGIFRENGSGRITLLDEDVRPSIHDISYVNYLPFKTSGNRSPLKTSPFRRHIWAAYVGYMVGVLEPTVVVPLGSWCTGSVEAELRALPGSPEVMRVWHPSTYNVNTRPLELRATWEPLSRYLRALD